MIDFKEELNKYQLIEIYDGKEIENHELSETLSIFSQVLNKTGKEQFKQNQKLEDILLYVEEESEAKKEINEIKGDLEQEKNEKLQILGSLMKVIDLYEDIYRFVLKIEESSWKNQIIYVWKKIGSILENRNIIRLDQIDKIYSQQFYIAKDVIRNNDLLDGEITEILRCGYIYKGEVLRKAEIIINKKDGEEKYL